MENKTIAKYTLPALVIGGVVLLGLGIWAFTSTQPNRLTGIVAQPTTSVTPTQQNPSVTATPSGTSTTNSASPTPTPTPAGCKFVFLDPSVKVTSPCNGQKATKGFTFKAVVPNIYSAAADKSEMRTYEVEIRDSKGNYMNWYGMSSGTVSSDGKTISFNVPMKYIRAAKTSHAIVHFYLAEPMSNTEQTLAKIDIIVK